MHDDDHDGEDRWRRGTASSCPDVGPGFHLDQRADRQLGHADGGAGRAVVAEGSMYTSFIAGVVAAEVLEEHGGLHDVGAATRPRTRAGREVGDRLAQLGLEPAARRACRRRCRPGRTRRATRRPARSGCRDRRAWSSTQSVSASGRRSASRCGQPVPPGRGRHRGEHRVGAAHRRAVALGSISTSIGGVSTARRTPNDRIVRSWTVAVVVDRDALATAPSDSAMWAAPMQYERSTTSSSGSPASTRTRTVPPVDLGLGRRAPVSGIGDRPAGRRGAGEQHDRLRPAGRAQVARRRRAGHVDLLDREVRARPTRSASAMPGVRTTRSDAACRRRRRPPATGGRFGPRRTTSSRSSSTRTGRPCSSARRAGRLADDASAACRRRRRRWPAAWPARRRARTTTRRSRGRRARPTSCAACRPVARRAPRAEASASTVVRRPCTLPAARPRLGERLAHRPAARAVGHRDQRVGRRGVVGEAALAERHAGADRAAGPPLERRPGRAAASRSRSAIGAPGRARSHASRIVRQPVQRHRWASSACSTAAWSAPGPWRAGPRAGTTMPGVQNPHWLAPVAQNASAHAVAAVGGEPVDGRDRAARPPAAPGSRRRPGAARRPAPCSSRTGPAGCTRPSATGAPSRSRSTSSSDDAVVGAPRPAGRRPPARAIGG